MSVVIDDLTADELEEIELDRAKVMGNWIVERRSSSPIINNLRINYCYIYLGDMLFGSSRESEGCTFELKVDDERKRIHLAFIGVAEGMRKQGRGSEMMRVLTGLADKYGYRIDLQVDTKFGSSKRRLINFYQRFGFICKSGLTYMRPVREGNHEGTNL